MYLLQNIKNIQLVLFYILIFWVCILLCTLVHITCSFMLEYAKHYLMQKYANSARSLFCISFIFCTLTIWHKSKILCKPICKVMCKPICKIIVQDAYSAYHHISAYVNMQNLHLVIYRNMQNMQNNRQFRIRI